jgi:hypothetical protein
MPFFKFRQKNNGGSFDGPEFIIIEAPDADAANEIALQHDIYFDGVEEEMDCPCCGDRWSPAWGKGDKKPTIYGNPAEEYISRWTNPAVKIVYLDGRVEFFPALSSKEDK